MNSLPKMRALWQQLLEERRAGRYHFKPRSRERFVRGWVSHINELREARGDEEDDDLQNLMAVRTEPRQLVEEARISESILIQEALFPLKCLES